MYDTHIYTVFFIAHSQAHTHIQRYIAPLSQVGKHLNAQTTMRKLIH